MRYKRHYLSQNTIFLFLICYGVFPDLSPASQTESDLAMIGQRCILMSGPERAMTGTIRGNGKLSALWCCGTDVSCVVVIWGVVARTV